MRTGGLLNKPLHSALFSCEKDTETIIKKLFVESQPYSDDLKRLLVLNVRDCMDKSNQNYQKIIDKTSVKNIIEENYFTTAPKIKMDEHEKVKSYIVLSYDNFIPTSNPEFFECEINFDILCPTEEWDIGNYQIRPIKIAGIIMGLLEDCRLSGIGKVEFIGMTELVLNEDLAGYSIGFRKYHGNDDNLPSVD